MFEFLVNLISASIELTINLINKELELVKLLDSDERWEGCGCAPERRCTCNTPTIENSSSISISFAEDPLNDVDTLPDSEDFLDVSDFISVTEEGSQFEYTSSDDITSMDADDEESDYHDSDDLDTVDPDLSGSKEIAIFDGFSKESTESSDIDDEEESPRVVLFSVVAPPPNMLPIPKWVQDNSEDRPQPRERDLHDIYDNPQPGPSHVLDPRAAAEAEWDTFEFPSSDDESFAHLSNSETESAEEEFLEDFTEDGNEFDREPGPGAVSPKELKNWIRASIPEVTMPTDDITFPTPEYLSDPIHITWPAPRDSIWSSARLNETLAREEILNHVLKPGEDPVAIFFKHFEFGTIPHPSRW